MGPGLELQAHRVDLKARRDAAREREGGAAAAVEDPRERNARS